MPRPSKEARDKYRLPTYHSSNRWRLRIEHAHGEKVFWWPANGSSSTPPPEVVADAVVAQDEWRGLVKDWNWIGDAMRVDQPEKDWSKPVWVDRRKAEAVLSRIRAEEAKERQRKRRMVLDHVARNGLPDLIAHAQQPGALVPDGERWNRLREQQPELWNDFCEDLEQKRLRLLDGLAPARNLLLRVTVRDALKAYLDYHEARTKLKAGDWIKKSTFKAMRKMLLASLGMSAKLDTPQVRETPIDLDNRLPDRDTLEKFARFWHGMPEGVKSSRTIRNWLGEARIFFRWCQGRDYGFTFPEDVARLFTSEDVKTSAEPFDAQRIKRILAQGKTRGGHRLKMYALFGLMNGYLQSDCAEIANCDYFVADGEQYIQRFRSKESRPKRGSRPIRIKHWIPQELAALIAAERGVNPEGYLFNSERGKLLIPKLVTNIWTEAVANAGDDLPFKQLRKMGYNRIKHHAVSREVAELWDGHSGRNADNYDDGIFEPVIEAQKRFAQELRTAGIL